MLKFIWHTVLCVSLALHSMCLTAQTDGGDKVVTLTVSGRGLTPDAAKQSALRNAIEQAFGTFISSHTEILNDQLVKDEIVSVSNGNIQAFDVLSEVAIPGGGYASTLKATVSINRLTSFVESKGVAVEFKGALFAMNIKQQLLNEESELKAMADLADVMKQISDKSFDYFIAAGEPTANGQLWNIPLTVTVKPNANLKLIPEYLSKVLAGLSMNADEVDNYRKLNKPWFSVAIRSPKSGYDVYALRNERSVNALSGAIGYFVHSLEGFAISDGLTSRSMAKLDSSSSAYSGEGHHYIQSFTDHFRPVVIQGCNGLGSWSLLERDYSNSTKQLLLYARGMHVSGEDIKSAIRQDKEMREGRVRDVHDFEVIPLVHGTACSKKSFKIQLAMGTKREVVQDPVNYAPRAVNTEVAPTVNGGLFPDIASLVNGWGETGVALQFQKLTDANGVAATFDLLDLKTLDELQKVSGYTVRGLGQ